MVAMKYQIIKPNAFLRKYVEHFWAAETEEYFRYISPASTLTDLVFFCEGTMKNTQNREELSESGIIFGPKTLFDNYEAVFPKAKLLGIRVRPSVFLLTHNIPATALSGQRISLQDLFSYEGERLTEKILNSQTLTEVVGLFSNFLIQKATDLPLKYQSVERWLSQTNFLSRDVSMKNICLSQRQFERNFKEFTGFSLRKYIKIKRFKQVFRYLQSTKNKENLTEIAYRFGYYDQAHFNRNFKEFTNLSPLQLFQKI
ncbi:helix-turn-helix domain-containing protein [Tannerella forsythia]|uniref:AraC family transcriptional regulator n=1 Tax=Tannerella forsythia TaxID=28112 RepID=A0A3P1XS51_TANFO|nr:helix-turn-helix domain-containing protein [Tannerella forsythia]RRD60767.1 AraC family transcriptional regulator [Tannerella forsythia]